jgi:hypothetical protein
VKKQVMVEGVVEVSEYALRAHEMRLTGIMHVEAHLLDRVGDVRPGEGEVLESLGQARVANRVADPPPPCQRGPWPEYRLAWSRACNHSCQCTQGYPECTGAGEGRDRQVAAPLGCRGSGEEGRCPLS